ncbi:chemotaxis protein CheC [Periweissella ghanensis]|uniref:CheY-P phosphatase CheC n=1 Tax=Periweissella ghanensis TaxID=467997 RepID=A0ABM8Z8Y3_9LACO|nr:chemotaxis protein CheC [Periweissella ghanensis]MCM0601012.1 chemotaxis protein CheC [Periweissella ghanensis]CAH0417907.1 CheY-P phosphatase CheC [Periweissella ghanensis]
MKFNDQRLDSLREIVNVGGGHAATSLAVLTGKRIEMALPDVKLLAYQSLFTEVLAADEVVDAVYNQIEGDLTGVFLFVVSHETSNLLAQFMTGSSVVSPELQQSAVNELGNIIANSFLRAVGDLIGLQVQANVPTLMHDVFGALITSTYMELEQYDDQILVIRNEFKYAQQNLDASLFFIPASGNLEKMFDAIGL